MAAPRRGREALLRGKAEIAARRTDNKTQKNPFPHSAERGFYRETQEKAASAANLTESFNVIGDDFDSPIPCLVFDRLLR